MRSHRRAHTGGTVVRRALGCRGASGRRRPGRRRPRRWRPGLRRPGRWRLGRRGWRRSGRVGVLVQLGGICPRARAGGWGGWLEQERHGGRGLTVLRLERSGRRLGGAPRGLLRGERRGRGRGRRWRHAAVIRPCRVASCRLVQQARCLVPARQPRPLKRRAIILVEHGRRRSLCNSGSGRWVGYGWGEGEVRAR